MTRAASLAELRRRDMDGEDDDGAGLAQPICWFCGEPELLEIGDIYLDSNFCLTTCCLSLLECVTADMHADPHWARELLRRLGAEALTGRRLRRVCDGEGSVPMLDYKLDVRPVSFRDAAAFVRTHHVHAGPPTTWRFGASLFNGWVRLGVVMVGNPVARAFMHRGMVEVTRLCIRRDVEPMLRAGACSTLYSWSAAEAQRRGFSEIITYTRRDEDGASLRAANWMRAADVPGRSWHSARRKRSNRNNAFVAKLRWSRTLRPKPKAPVASPRAEPALVPDWMQVGDTRLVPPLAVPIA